MTFLLPCLPFFVLFLHFQQVKAFCYHPDGSQILDLAFQPCNRVPDSVSMCCGTNHMGSINPDVCESNGLCKNTGDNLRWREGCTDPTWKDPHCLNFCTGGPRGGTPTKNSAVIQCSDGTWCCGGSNRTCCSNKLGLSIAATIGASALTQTPTFTAGLVSTSISPSNTPTSKPSSGEGLSSGAKIGVGVGVAVGALAVLAVAAFIFWKRRRILGGQTPMKEEHVNHDPADPVYHEADGQGIPAKTLNPTEPRYHEVSGDIPDAGSTIRREPAELSA